jgi:hypothetical protein
VLFISYLFKKAIMHKQEISRRIFILAGADAAIAVHMANRAMGKGAVVEWKASYSYAGG